MKTIFNVPVSKFAVPFDRVWKALILHVFIALVITVFYIKEFQYDLVLFSKATAQIFLHNLAQAFAHIIVYYKLDQKFGWLTETKKRIITSIVFHLATTYSVFFTILPLLMVTLLAISISQAFDIVQDGWIIAFVATVLGIVFGLTGEFFNKWKRSLAAEEKLQAEMMSYKYESLRNQLNPHFLLDSFAGLKKLILRDPNQASDFIQKISGLYRHVLEVQDKEFISLREEMDYLQVYQELLLFRFGDSLTTTFDVTVYDDDLIIPLTLQSVMEEIIESQKDLGAGSTLIHIQRQHDMICIEGRSNRGSWKRVRLNGVIANLQQQYQFYSKRPVNYHEQVGKYSVMIPLLKQA